MKKILFIFLLVFAILLVAHKSSFAAETTSPWLYNGSAISNEINSGKPALGNLVLGNISAMAGITRIGIVGEKRPIVNSQGVVVGYKQEGGVIGSMERVVSMMTGDQGISSKEYIADMGHDLGIIPKEAYAQGTSFSSLAPILPLWKKMRDITYLFYVIIFLIVGFMILLRKKLDPRTVITIEMALPKLVLTLILITFSFAIMSLILDIANLTSTVIGNLFASQFIANARGITLQNVMNKDIFMLVRPISNVQAIGEKVNDVLNAAGAGSAGAGIAAIIIDLIFAFAVLFISFKIFFALLGPFVGVILSVILSPIQLLMMAIPGSESNLGSFLKGFIAKVAVFPIVWFMLIIASIMGTNTPVINGSCQGTFVGVGGFLPCADWGATQINMTGAGLYLVPFAGWGPVAGELIAFGILFTIPSVAQLVQNALKVKDQGADIAGQTIRKGMSKVPFMKSLAE